MRAVSRNTGKEGALEGAVTTDRETGSSEGIFLSGSGASDVCAALRRPQEAQILIGAPFRWSALGQRFMAQAPVPQQHAGADAGATTTDVATAREGRATGGSA